MWKEDFKSYIKNNCASSGSIFVSVFIATLFLSFLCSLFFNFWLDDIHRIVAEEGDWQGRIVAEVSKETILQMEKLPNIEKIIINKELSREKGTVIDLYFDDMRTIFEDIPFIVEEFGLEEGEIQYHSTLLSRYLIHDPKDWEPPLLLSFYLMILIVVSFSLILIIRNSFAVSMNDRIRQFGIFSSIGATPRQILLYLMQEAAMLCILPMVVGTLFGIFFSFLVIQAMGRMAIQITGARAAEFVYHPVIFIITIVIAGCTVFFSAWMPARKLSKITPLEAVRQRGEIQWKRKKNSYFLTHLFGIEGELAGNTLKTQKKAFRTSTLSLTLSFFTFIIMLCFFTLSGISTKHTYFEKYQEMWDIVTTVKDMKIENFRQTEEIQKIPDVRRGIVYQREEALTKISRENQSRELQDIGGLEYLIGEGEFNERQEIEVGVSLIILDDTSFIEYCKQIGVEPNLDGAIVWNQVWDSLHSDYRHKKFLPFVKENLSEIELYPKKENRKVEVPILAYTEEVPPLKEEYEKNAFVQFLSVSLWKEFAEQFQMPPTDLLIQTLAREGVELEELERLETEIKNILEKEYEIESENRIQEKITNDKMIQGYEFILGAFCVLLAIIGLSNVFSNTLTFLYQRKTEFAQYLSVGMTPGSMKKMFCIEVFVIIVRPILISVPVAVAMIAFMIRASHLDFTEVVEFFASLPVIPILIFLLFIGGFVILAYYLGARRVLNSDLTEVLKRE